MFEAMKYRTKGTRSTMENISSQIANQQADCVGVSGTAFQIHRNDTTPTNSESVKIIGPKKVL